MKMIFRNYCTNSLLYPDRYPFFGTLDFTNARSAQSPPASFIVNSALFAPTVSALPTDY